MNSLMLGFTVVMTCAIDGVFGCYCTLHPQDVFKQSDFVLRISVDKASVVDKDLHYAATVKEIFKDTTKKSAIESQITVNGGHERLSCSTKLKQGTERIVVGYERNDGSLRLTFCTILFKNSTETQLSGLRGLYEQNAACKASTNVRVLTIDGKPSPSTTCSSKLSFSCLISEGICVQQEDGGCQWKVNTAGCKTE